jgi:hypothetical protein
MNMRDVSGSTPDARYAAAVAWEACRSSLGLCGTVIACRSTTQKKVSEYKPTEVLSTQRC